MPRISPVSVSPVPSAAVRDHSFEAEVEAPPFGLPGPSCRYGSSTTVTGTFDSGQGATGTIRDELIDGTFNVAATRNLTFKRYKVKIGTHRFKVRASDPAGNRDRTLAKDTR